MRNISRVLYTRTLVFSYTRLMNQVLTAKWILKRVLLEESGYLLCMNSDDPKISCRNQSSARSSFCDARHFCSLRHEYVAQRSSGTMSLQMLKVMNREQMSFSTGMSWIY